MELWIRSQIGYTLIKCIMLELDNDKTGIFAYNGDNHMVLAGKYKTQERALEVLDEIQDKFKNKYLAKVHPIVTHDDFVKIIKTYEEINGIDLIGSNELVDITPINQEVLVYEMPKE